MNSIRNTSSPPSESHVGISVLPETSFISVAASSSAGLPFLPFDLSSASNSFPPPGAFKNSGFFEDEPPLLEELGINPVLIFRKIFSILNPIRINQDLHDDADLSGPFLLLILFGIFQLLAGKVHFGVILGWMAVASAFLYAVCNLLAGRNGSLHLYRCLSSVGYCLLPMVMFSAISLFMPHGGPAFFVIASLVIIWCTRACTNLLVWGAPHAEEHTSLVAYACFLIYTAFSLLVIF